MVSPSAMVFQFNKIITFIKLYQIMGTVGEGSASAYRVLLLFVAFRTNKHI